MNKITYIEENIRALPHGNHFLSYREVQELPQILADYENILHLATATLENLKGILVATNKRLLFLYIEQGNTRFFQIQYEDIQHVYHQYGSMQSRNASYGIVGGNMELSLISRKVQISDLFNEDIDILNKLIKKPQNNTSTNSYMYNTNPYVPVKNVLYLEGF